MNNELKNPDRRERPVRVLIAAMIIALSFPLFMTLEIRYFKTLINSPYAAASIEAAVAGAAVCLISRRGIGWKIAGALTGAVSAALLAVARYAYNDFLRVILNDKTLAFYLQSPVIYRLVYRELAAVGLCLAAALVCSLIFREVSGAKAHVCGLISAASYIVWHFVSKLIYKDGSLGPGLLFAVTAAFMIYFSCAVLSSLSRMDEKTVKLRGVGTAWCALALAGAVFVCAMTVYFAVSGKRLDPWLFYAHNIILGAAPLVGYILLLCGRRVGLYVVILGVGIALCSQFVLGADRLLAMTLRGAEANDFWSLLYSTALGSLNPIFAWLTVRFCAKDDKPADADQG